MEQLRGTAMPFPREAREKPTTIANTAEPSHDERKRDYLLPMADNHVSERRCSHVTTVLDSIFLLPPRLLGGDYVDIRPRILSLGRFSSISVNSHG